jgi:hypothetical protein
MSITQADLIAAREAVDMIPKEAQIFGNEASAAYESRYEGADSPKYWLNRFKKEQQVNPNVTVKEFTEREWAKYLNDTAQYRDDVRAGGGMLDRYSGSAGGIGGVLGAMLGGLVGGAPGAAIGGLIGSLGLYAIQKLGLFEGTAVDEFFKNTVDKVFGNPVTPEDIEKKRIAMDEGMKKATEKLKEQAAGNAEPSPATDAEMWGETDPSNPNYNAGAAAAIPSAAAAQTFGPDIPDDAPVEVTQAPEMTTADRLPDPADTAKAGQAQLVNVPISPELQQAGAEARHGTSDSVSEDYMANEGQFSPESQASDTAPQTFGPDIPADAPTTAAVEAPVTPTAEPIGPVGPTGEGVAQLRDVQLDPQKMTPAPAAMPGQAPAAPVAPAGPKLDAQAAIEQMDANRDPGLIDVPDEALAEQDAKIAAEQKRRAEDVRRARDQMKRSKSVIGGLRRPATQAKEYGKTVADEVGKGLQKSKAGVQEGAGLVGDVADAAKSTAAAYGQRAKAGVQEGAGLVGDVAGAAKGKAGEFTMKTKKHLKDLGKDLKYFLRGE